MLANEVLLPSVTFFLLGILLGIFLFFVQKASIWRLNPDRARRARRTTTNQALLRVTFSAGLIVMALQWGVLPAISLVAGLWISRTLMVLRATIKPILAEGDTVMKG